MIPEHKHSKNETERMEERYMSHREKRSLKRHVWCRELTNNWKSTARRAKLNTKEQQHGVRGHWMNDNVILAAGYGQGDQGVGHRNNLEALLRMRQF